MDTLSVGDVAVRTCGMNMGAPEYRRPGCDEPASQQLTTFPAWSTKMHKLLPATGQPAEQAEL